MATDEAANLKTLEKMNEGFNTRNVELILEHFTEDGVFETSEGPDPWGQRHVGRAQIRASVEGVFRLLPDIAFRDVTRWVHGDRGVTEWTCVATTPKGHRMEVRGCDLFTFRDGKVARKDTYFKRVVRPR